MSLELRRQAFPVGREGDKGVGQGSFLARQRHGVLNRAGLNE